MALCKNCPKKKEFADQLCKECYLAENPLLISFKPINVLTCVGCNKYYLKGKWSKFSRLDEIIRKTIEKKITPNSKAKITSLIIKPKIPKHEKAPKTKLNTTANVAVIGRFEGKSTTFKEEYTVPVKVIFALCPGCSKHKSGYFEGVLQIRDADQEVIDFAKKHSRGQKERGIFLSKIEKAKNGVDLYLTKRGYIHELAQELVKQFGGETKSSRKIFSRDRQRSRDIYRINVLFRQSKFRKGDIVEIDNKCFVIKAIDRKLHAKNLMTGKKTEFLPSKHDIKGPLEAKETIVSNVFPKTEVLHPDTYQPVQLANKSSRKLKPGQKVKAVNFSGRILIAD